MPIPKNPFTPFSTRPEEKTTWFWDQRIPEGTLSLLCGNPDEGKGMFLMKMVADFTRGRNMPDGVPPNAKLIRSKRNCVLWISSEDSTTKTLKPRLRLFDGDQSKVFELPKTKKIPDGRLNLRDKQHQKLFDSWLKAAPEVSLVVFDPLESFVGEIDGNKGTEVRSVVDPLIKILESRNVTGIGICHLNKTSLEVTAKYRVKGSIAWVAAARSGWLISPHPTEPQEPQGGGRKVFVNLKNNLADDPRPGFSFLLGKKYKGITFEGAVTTTSNQAISKHVPSVVYEAVDWLSTFILSQKGRVLGTTVEAKAKSAGITEYSLVKAKKELGIKSVKSPSGPWYWSLSNLPHSSQSSQSSQSLTAPKKVNNVKISKNSKKRIEVG